MDIRTGLDLCEISRIERLINETRFLDKYFSENERIYFAAHGNRAESIAAAFSAKEAFSKALGTGVSGFSLCEVEVLHNDVGKPYFNFLGRVAETVKANSFTFDVSLTHTETTAAAVVICQREEKA